MEKLKNNTSWGKIVLLCNVLVLILFVVSMFSLLKFDKTNRAVIDERSNFNKLYEGYAQAQHPIRQDSAEVAYYTNKLDSLMQRTAASKDEKKALQESIEVTKETLAKKKEQQTNDLENLTQYKAEYEPALANWESLNADNDKAKKGFLLFACVTLVLFLVKTFFMALWMSRNNRNLHAVCPWMKDGMKPWLAYLAWFVPVYNLIKPLSYFNEIWSESQYYLENAGVDKRDENKVENTNLYMAIWWVLMLCSVWFMNILLYGTFFREGALFVKTNHTAVVIVAIVVMVLCMCVETALILAYNKKNLKMLGK